MARRKSHEKAEYVRKSWQTRLPGKATDTHEKAVMLCLSLLQSQAYLDLSGNASKLYNYLLLQYKGDDIEQFVFNWAMACKVFPLYKNPNSFRKDINELITQGFIDCTEHGNTTRTKNIYAFSDRWKDTKAKPRKQKYKNTKEARAKRQDING